MSQKKISAFELRSGAVEMLHFVVKLTDLETIGAELERHLEGAQDFFENEAVALDLRRLGAGERLDLERLAELLTRYRLRAQAVIANDAQREWVGTALPVVETRARAPVGGEQEGAEAKDSKGAKGKTGASNGRGDKEAAAAPARTADALAETMAADSAARRFGAPQIVDRPLRSGQRVYAEGDLIVLGLVSYGAEVIAEGNIHIYAPLRGRALAGVQGNHEARIFCTCLEPELISIAGIYRTSEQPLPGDLRGRAAQVALENEKLLFLPLGIN